MNEFPPLSFITKRSGSPSQIIARGRVWKNVCINRNNYHYIKSTVCSSDESGILYALIQRFDCIFLTGRSKIMKLHLLANICHEHAVCPRRVLNLLLINWICSLFFPPPSYFIQRHYALRPFYDHVIFAQICK